MESFTPSTFICENCGERHYKYLPPGTKKTTCHKCGNLINTENIIKLGDEYIDPNKLINNDKFHQYMRRKNNPFEMGEEFPEYGDKIDYDKQKNQFFFDTYKINSDMNKIIGNNKNGNYEIYSNKRFKKQNIEVEEDLTNNSKLTNKFHLNGNKINLLGSVMTFDMKQKAQINNEKMTKNMLEKNEKGEIENPTCSICLANIRVNDNVTKLKCNHLFHFKCIEKWLKINEECPFCRTKLKKKKFIEHKPQKIINKFSKPKK